MSYPPAPWHLYGTALQSFHAIDVETAKQLVPLDFDIVSVLPGKTVGSVYLSVYEPNSTLQYHELIMVPALVRYRGKIGAWISHIYVDNPQSVEGGRNIWGLPKQLADFTWDERQISVSHDRNLLCRVDRSPIEIPLSLWQKIKVSADVFGGLERDVLAFQGNLEAPLKWSPFRLNIPAASPLATIDLGDPVFTVQFDGLHLKANPPAIVGSAHSLLSEASLN
ncbi:acetoacetate decarboxylase family protein [Chamaesiphon polymorphus]|uniref:Acetoacetate decarboxylase n=1 Tax=Chamaesiphon polymorphus CCALA 037 TaxID=2107692 RepID=A0A2T1GE95_9CYAN|nr:acetoacetate decarboxylase family protein [Chamaesiphon polymorphus]PSB55804.1 acetoacetate decarboxylase [Chamaesiphon polymorphus CCALA 037]